MQVKEQVKNTRFLTHNTAMCKAGKYSKYYAHSTDVAVL